MNLHASNSGGIATAVIGPDEELWLPPGRARDVCISLRNAILEHDLKPGAKLSEDEVGEVFEASRTVVRAALQALTHSGLVTIARNRGAFVSRPGPREAHEVFEARALIEPRVAHMAAERMDDAQLARLTAHIESEHEALHAQEIGKALSLSGRFHIAIAEVADQQVMTGIVRSLISRSSLVIALYWKRADAACESHAHNALLEAFEAQDGDSASQIMRSHIVDLHSGLDLAQPDETSRSLADLLREREGLAR